MNKKAKVHTNLKSWPNVTSENSYANIMCENSKHRTKMTLKTIKKVIKS